MEHLTIDQRVKIIKSYYKNNDSVVSTFRALRADYGRHNRPTKQTILNTVNKFEQTGSVTDIVRSVHHRNIRNAENIASVAESVEEDPNLSIPRRAQHLGLSYGSLWRILHLEKKNKMAERPKRPLSAYMIWLSENREAIKKENPGLKVTEIANRGGELWRALKDKTEWENKAAVMKDEYTKPLKEFEANGGTTEKPSRKRGGKATKKPVKKGKKKESEDEDDDEEEESE